MVVLLLLGAVLIVCAALVYATGDLAKLQEKVSAEEGQAALRDVTDPQQLDQVLERYPSNRILKLIALANGASLEIDAGVQTLLNEAEPGDLSKPIDLGALSRGDLDALRKDLKIAQSNAPAVKPRYASLVTAARDRLASGARALNLDNDTVSDFMAMIGAQHGKMLDVMSKMLEARAEYYRAYELRVAFLQREFGIYKVSNGQFVFPFSSTADGYNRAAAAMTAAADRVAELERARAALRQEQLDGWKTFVDRRVTGKHAQ